MKIKLKPWDEVVRLEEERTGCAFKNGIDDVFGLYEYDLPWGNCVTSKPADSDGDYFVNVTAWVHDWMVDKDEPTSDDLLRYGEVVTDDAYASVGTDFGKRQAVRIRLISYNGELYYHKMVAGDVVECRKVGKTYA